MTSRTGNYNDRRKWRGGGPRNKYGQNIKVKGTTVERKDADTGTSFGDAVEANTSKKTPKKGRARSHTDIPGVPFKMGYPVARGPGDDTGDYLLIKCVSYVPPKTGLVSQREKVYAKRDGPFQGKDFKKGDVITATDSRGTYDITQPIKGTIRLKNQGATGAIKESGAKPVFYIQLPIPQDVNDSNVVTWGDDSMNIFQLAGVAAASSIMKNPIQSFNAAKELFSADAFKNVTIDEVAQDSINAAIAGKAIDALGGNIRPNSVLGRSTGVILNSNLELLFGGVNLRTFPFNINFSPRSEEESAMVLSIIKALKSAMAAKKNADVGGQGGVFLRAPDVFQLRYMSRGRDHPFLNSIKDCALTGMNVNYTNSGTYATYGDSTPVSIQMSLTFKELNPIYFEDYQNPLPGVGF